MTNNNRHTELIDHIRQSLQEHEEPYVPGAWESFQQHQKSSEKGASGWKIPVSVAASLLFLISLLFVIDNYNSSIPDASLAEYKQQETGKSELPPVRANSEDKGKEKSPSRRSESPADTETDSPAVPESIVPEGESMAAVSPFSSSASVISAGFRELYPILLTGEAPPGSGDLQLAPSQAGGGARSRTGPVEQHAPAAQRVVEKRIQSPQGRNLRFGLAYAPLINSNSTGAEWSMGGGFYTEWSFARDLALSSGVLFAQNQLEFDQEIPARTVDPEQITFAYLQADLLSMEIPLSLQYALTDNLSVSAGISSLAYLKEQYDYTYEFQREIQVMTFTEDSGYEPQTTTVTILESEHQSEDSFSAIDWAGFYTFSVSYKHDFSNNYSLALEPFMKLPSGPLTSRDLKYYTGGLQMKISF